jgi:GABA(A) receptor-associated protein
MTDDFESSFMNQPLAKRVEECVRIRRKYPDRVPIVVQRANAKLKDIDKHKYLVPAAMTYGEFFFTIRKRLTLKSDQGIYLFVNNTLPKHSDLISLIYKDHKDKDGFLYIKYDIESTFG